MAEKIEVGVVIKGADKAATDITKVSDSAKGLGSSIEGADEMVGMLEGGLDKMTNGAYSGFKNAAMGIKTFIIGLKATKTAIIATGIGALVVAFGLLVVYWDDIKEAVSGVSVEQEKLLRYTEGTRDAAQQQLTIIEQTQSTRLLEGDSQRDILKLKMQQTNEILLATGLILEQQKQQKEGQVKAAERNQKITAGFLAFLTLPLSVLFGAVDALTFGLAKLGVLEEATTLVKDAAMWTASFIFDPKKVEEDGEAVIKGTEKQLRDLKNARDGFQLQLNAMDKADADAAAATAATKLSTEEELALELARLRAENLSDAEATALALLEIERKTTIQGLIEKGAGFELILASLKNFSLRKIEITKSYEEERQAIQDAADAKTIAAEEATAKAVKAARLGIVAAGFQALKSMAKTEEGQKRLAISQILVNQGIAMAEAYRGAMQSATGTGPLAAFTAPGFTSTMIGMVLSSFASIKGVMNQAGAASGSVGTSSGGGGGGGSTQLALTPSLDSFEGGTLELPAVQAYILQNNIADADALAQALQNQSSL